METQAADGGRIPGSSISRDIMGDDLVAQAEAREAEAYEFFTSHDLDRNGSIDRDELVAVLNDLGLRGEGDDDSAMRTLVDKCMQEHDVNSDGKLSFSEFKLMYNAAKGVKPEDMRGASRRPGTVLVRQLRRGDKLQDRGVLDACSRKWKPTASLSELTPTFRLVSPLFLSLHRRSGGDGGRGLQPSQGHVHGWSSEARQKDWRNHD